jgi:hypothetical protein
MTQAPLARQNSDRVHGGDEPATVAFRRPEVRGAARANSREPGHHLPVEVVLRLPDLAAVPLSPAASLAERGNPLVGRMMWVATGVLAVIAVALIATAPDRSPQPIEQAPRWGTSERPSAPGGASDPADRESLSNWRAPGESNESPPSSATGPWRVEAQSASPHEAAGAEPPFAEEPPPAGSAAWPGDSWPGVNPGGSDPQSSGEMPPAYAPPQNSDYPSTAPADPAWQEPAGTDANSDQPQYDPWPGPPQWPDDARRAAPGQAMAVPDRTAGRPGFAPTAGGSKPAARLEGGIRNPDLSPSYDSTRSSLH